MSVYKEYMRIILKWLEIKYPLPKLRVAGSIPVSRSSLSGTYKFNIFESFLFAPKLGHRTMLSIAFPKAASLNSGIAVPSTLKILTSVIPIKPRIAFKYGPAKS